MADLAPGVKVSVALQAAHSSSAAPHPVRCGTIDAFPIREKKELQTLQARLLSLLVLLEERGASCRS